MTEQAPKDQTPEQPEDSPSDGNAGDDLEALLAEASSLAGELSNETGTPSAPDPAPEPVADPAVESGETDPTTEPVAEGEPASDETPAPASDPMPEPAPEPVVDPAVESGETDPTTEPVAEGEPASDETPAPASDPMPEPAPEPVVDPSEHVETQLAELEELASTIGEELGANVDDQPDAPNEAANATQDETASGTAIATDPPDFMKEFTDADVPSLDDPDDESTPSPSNQLATSSHSPLSAADAEAVGIVPTRNPPPTSGAESESLATPTASDGVNADTPSRANRIRGSIIASPALLGIGALGATLLELADKPFGRLGHKVRILIGLVAIATVATSLLVFAVSLF